jgi:hypothetical protein
MTKGAVAKRPEETAMEEPEQKTLGDRIVEAALWAIFFPLGLMGAIWLIGKLFNLD